MEKNLFEIATKRKYRFTYKGWISVEELWDMTLEELDGIYKTLKKLMDDNSGESLMTEKKVDENLVNKIEIVKYIFSRKKAEQEAKKLAIENAEKRKRIMDILAEKKDESLKNASEEELMKMLDDLK